MKLKFKFYLFSLEHLVIQKYEAHTNVNIIKM